MVSELRNLPLALAQVAAVIAGQQASYETYLERLRALPAGEHLAPEPAQHYPPGVAAAAQQVTSVLVDGALQRLARWSLLAFSVDGQTIIMHDLAARVIRDRLARRQWLMAVGRAAALALEAQSRLLTGSQDRPAIRDIPEQAMALAENLGRSAVGADEELMRALLRLRLFALSQLLELGDSAS